MMDKYGFKKFNEDCDFMREVLVENNIKNVFEAQAFINTSDGHDKVYYAVFCEANDGKKFVFSFYGKNGFKLRYKVDRFGLNFPENSIMAIVNKRVERGYIICGSFKSEFIHFSDASFNKYIRYVDKLLEAM